MMNIFAFFLIFVASTVRADIRQLDGQQEVIALEYLRLRNLLPDTTALQEGINKGHRESTLQSIAEIRKFFALYDQFNLAKIDYFYTEILNRAHAEALAETTRRGRLSKKALIHLKTLENLIVEYNSLVPHFGTEMDMLRLNVAHKILPSYANFAKALREARGEKPWRNFGSAKIVPFVDTAFDFTRVSGKFLKLLWAAYANGRTGKQDRAPIPEALAAVQTKLVKMRNVKTSWEGLENIKGLEHDGKTLHMFLINHANSFFDTSAQQAFPVKGMSSMGNVDVFFPAFLARRMVKSDHMITVGHGDTTQKTIDLVQSKQLNRFFLAIEGITGTGLYEMRPVMPLFDFAVYDSIERGLNLKLYPVAFPDNFRLMNDWRAPIEGPRVARGIVLPPVTTETCLNLKEITGTNDAVAQLIRWSWFSTLRNSSDEVLSMPFPSEIKERLERMVWGMD